MPLGKSTDATKMLASHVRRKLQAAQQPTSAGATEVATRARVAGGAARGHSAIVKGRPDVISWSKDGTPLSFLAFTVADGHITEITAVVDPTKLGLLNRPDPV
jgi:hypothetical protein